MDTTPEDACDEQAFYASGEEDPRVYSVSDLMACPREDLQSLDSERLQATSPVVIAQFFERLEVDECRLILRKLTIEGAAEVLAEMDEEWAAEIFSAMRESRALDILEGFEPDDAADILAELDEADRERLLDRMDDESAETVKDLLSYPADSAGGIMNPDVDTVLADQTVEETIQRIRTIADKYEDLHYVYVVDDADRLLGIVSLRKLIQAKPQQPIRDIMRTDIKGVVLAETDQEEVARLMAEYNLADLAVVNAERELLGVITHDDVIDIIQEEATEDLQKLSGAGGDESVHDDISFILSRRLPWLLVNLLTAYIASSVVSLFEGEIGVLPLLAAFMPIIAGIGGNTGQQALGVAIRGLALGEVHDSDTRMILMKQCLIGLINGLAVGFVAALAATAITQNWMLGLVVLLAMIGNMCLGSLSGAFIPLMLKKFGRDPAQSSSIFLTGITDTGGFFIFLSLASLLLL